MPGTNRRRRAGRMFGDPLTREERRQVKNLGVSELDVRLARCPDLEKALIWRRGQGTRVPYRRWSQSMRDRLAGFFSDLCAGKPSLPMKLPGAQNIDQNSGCAFFTAEQAFDVYAAHAAHAFYVECQHFVPWSLATLTPAELAFFFSSESYHAIIKPSQNTYPPGIQAGRDFAEIPEEEGLAEFLGDPREGLRFLTGQTSTSGKSLIGRDQLHTLALLTAWLRDNVGHGGRDRTDQHRWLPNRLRAASGLPIALANAGCHSASKLMVDLARSVNIPLLHARAQESDSTSGHFFNRTHGGLIFGWDRANPRVLWHTDEIYAQPGEPCYPLDASGALLPTRGAIMAYFDQRWRTPAQLAQAGFVYNLQTVSPGQGFGDHSRGAYEDREHYGQMSGYWRTSGASKLQCLARLEQSYELCGADLLSLYCDQVLEPQLAILIRQWIGAFPASQLPPLHPLSDYSARAAAAVNALGGCSAARDAMRLWENTRGNNLMP